MTQNLRYFATGAYTNYNDAVYTLTGTGVSGYNIGSDYMNSMSTFQTYTLGTNHAVSYKEHFEKLGVLYNWNMAMDSANTRGATASAAGTTVLGAIPTTSVSYRTGICPPGWKLPSDYDYNMLEKYVATTYAPTTAWSTSYETATGWRPNDDGEAAGSGRWGTTMKGDMKIGVGAVYDAYNNKNPSGRNSSGFSAVLSGTVENGSAFYFGTNSVFWSSSENGSSGWYRTFYHALSGMYRYGNTGKSAYSFSVRCKK